MVEERPFRWQVHRREALGRLLVGDVAAVYAGFTADLRRCAAAVLGAVGDSDVVFVGRSPESLFDYLSGALGGTSWAGRLGLLQLSLRDDEPDRLLGTRPQAVLALRRYLAALGLGPDGLIARRRPVALVDLVCDGYTFGNLARLLETWCREQRGDWTAAHRKLRFVGITQEARPAPGLWQWRKHAGWRRRVPRSRLVDVTAPERLWDCLGNWQLKTTRSHHAKRWAEPVTAPPRGADELKALRRAARLVAQGSSPEERARLRAELVRQRAMRWGWFRRLCRELRYMRRMRR